MARRGNSADRVPKNLKALRSALEHSVTIQMAKLHEITDDLVSRGSLSRAEADKLVGHLVSSSKTYSHALLQVVDTVTTEARKNVEAGVATAEKIADTVLHAPNLVPGRKRPAKKAAKKSAGSSRTTPSAKVQKLPAAEPIPGLADLTVAQVKPKLARLSAAELRRVRQAESAGKARKGVLAEIDRLLEK